MAYQTVVDIGNRALQWCGEFQIATLYDDDRAAYEVNQCFDKLRAAELRKIPWRWATRRATLRALTATSARILPGPWVVGTAYSAGQLIYDPGQYLNSPMPNGEFTVPLGVNSQLGIMWICVIGHTSSLANAPGNLQIGVPPYWQQYYGPLWADLYSTSVTYNAGDLCYSPALGDSPIVYLSLVNNNLNHTPSSSPQWVVLGSGTGLTGLTYPLAAGVAMTINGTARNIFPLPNGYLRATAPDPKVKASGWLATSAGLRILDYEFEGDYIVTAQTAPIVLRFVADISDVTQMEPLFCETWAASMGSAMITNLGPDVSKANRVDKAYQGLFDLAALINGLEIGSTENLAGAARDQLNDVAANKGR